MSRSLRRQIAVRVWVGTGDGPDLQYLAISCFRCGAHLPGPHFVDVANPDGPVDRICLGCRAENDVVVDYEENT